MFSLEKTVLFFARTRLEKKNEYFSVQKTLMPGANGLGRHDYDVGIRVEERCDLCRGESRNKRGCEEGFNYQHFCSHQVALSRNVLAGSDFLSTGQTPSTEINVSSHDAGCGGMVVLVGKAVHRLS